MRDETFKTLVPLCFMGFGFGFSAAQAQNHIPAEQSPAPRAIQCSAALELMARAAPSWSDQVIVQQARYYWRSEAERLAQSAGRNTTTEIGQEMGLMAEQAVSDPNALSTQATLCLSDVPGPGNTMPALRR